MSLRVGDRLGRYEITAPLGAGGMGEVWEALDSDLERRVAIKVLPDAVAKDPKRIERFRREARALAAFSHPNLLDIYDVGAIDGLSYVVTELLDGESLRSAISTTGMPWKKVTEIGAAIAEGLAAAHSKGIIHRDLKPENVFITAEGRVKILDFGLAAIDDQEEPDSESPTVTEAGTVLGTVGYTAPEQLEGQRADLRSDIFSLGCVLYEMASGRRAFRGDSQVAVMAAILKEHPPQLSSTGATVPVDFERAVHRCLEKRPEARFHSAADLAYTLKEIGAGTTAPEMATPKPDHRIRRWQIAVGAALALGAAIIAWQALGPKAGQTPAAPTLDPNRIAVVPFVNRTADVALDGLAAMTMDRLTQGLAELEELEVAPASAVVAAAGGAGTGALVRDVARATDSGLVLTGVWDSVGDGLELQGTLEDAQTETIVYAFDPIPVSRETPEQAIATLRDWTLMAVQDHLHPILAWAAGDRFPNYEAYLMYRRFFETLHAHGPGTAMEALQLKVQSVQTDPEFVRPRIQQGSTWMPGLIDYIQDFGLAFYNPVHDLTLTTRQQQLVAMIDARLGGRWENSFRLAQDAYERDPSDTMQRIQLMMSASFDHRPGYVVELFEWSIFDALMPDTYRFVIVGFVIDAYHRLGRHEEELALARRLLAAGPTTTPGGSARSLELRALAAMGRMTEIEAILAEVMLEPDPLLTDGEEMLSVVHELKAHGFLEESRELAEQTVEWYEVNTVSAPEQRCDPCMADALAAAGRYDEACSLFEDILSAEPDARAFVKEVGKCAARGGDRPKAIEMEARIGQIGAPVGPMGVPYGYRGTTHMLEAGIATALGDRDRAIRLIQQAISAGYANYQWLHVNPDFEPLWSNPEFEEIFRPKE